MCPVIFFSEFQLAGKTVSHGTICQSAILTPGNPAKKANTVNALTLLVTISALLFSGCAFTAGKSDTNGMALPTTRVLSVGGAEIELVFNQHEGNTSGEPWVSWVRDSAQTVADFYDGFPVRRVAVNLVMDAGGGVRTGRAYQGVEMPQIVVWVGSDSDAGLLARDWIMVHEMIHLATASLPRRHHWLEEGLSVYIESVARAQSGSLGEVRVWHEFYRRMPHGQPQSDDKGLDFTPTWGRTYWGGAVFCLLADIAIREHTDNRQSLRDAVQSVVREKLTMNRRADMDMILQAMDRPFDKPIVRELYETYANSPTPFNLEGVWHELGITLVNGRIRFDDSARLAHIRRAITSAS